ncbi:MAG: universal stress protein [Rubrivivax sp.]|nr:MAG: universal stress protein [Rubrivivax sp.]
MKILLAVDGSAFTKRMLAWLATHDEFLAGQHQYTVLTVPVAIPPHAASMFSTDDLKAYYLDAAEAIFKPIRKFMARQDATVGFESKPGNAAEVIAKLAEKGKFDLVIMGSHGQGNLMNLVTGSVATQVLARCKTPVLLIR